MKRLVLPSLALLLLVAFLTVAVFAAQAAPDAPFAITWDAIAAGGVSTGGPYTLADALGQPAAGASSGGAFTLADGFQAVAGIGPIAPPATNRVYLPTVLK